MTSSPCLIRAADPSGGVCYELGHPLVDRYLMFVAGRARPNTVRATAFDLKTFFGVVARDPLEVRSVDVLDFIAAQRGDRKVVRLADGESVADHRPSPKLAMRLMAVMLGRNTYAAALVVTKLEKPVTSIGGRPPA